MRDPNLTKLEIDDIIASGKSDKNVLCLVDVYDFYNYVTDRYKAILKLERDIEEIKELSIGMYALVKVQGKKIDKIADHIERAKTDCQISKDDLVVAYKIKKKCKIF